MTFSAHSGGPQPVPHDGDEQQDQDEMTTAHLGVAAPADVMVAGETTTVWWADPRSLNPPCPKKRRVAPLRAPLHQSAGSCHADLVPIDPGPLSVERPAPAYATASDEDPPSEQTAYPRSPSIDPTCHK